MDKLANQMNIVVAKAGGDVKFTADIDYSDKTLVLSVVVYKKAPTICTNWVTFCNYSHVYSACKAAARQFSELFPSSRLRVLTVMSAYGRLLKRANSDLGHTYLEVMYLE